MKSKFKESAAVRASVQEINNKPFLVTGPIITPRDPQSVLAVTQGPRWRGSDLKGGFALHWTGVKQFSALTISSVTVSDSFWSTAECFVVI